MAPVTESLAGDVETHVPPPERTNFRSLLLSNPNYFGNLNTGGLEPVKVESGNTTYEQLFCVGYNPDLNVLKAVVQVKLDSGYGGGLCGPGSKEYVRFYLSFDNGGSWEDEGVVSVTTYDLQGVKPLDYALSLRPKSHTTRCARETLPRVRAILSWSLSPPANTPGFVPVWGNVVEAHIQIHPQQIYYLGDLLAEAKVKLPVEFDSATSLAVSPSKTLSPAELLSTYANKGVQVHRLLYPQLYQQLLHPELLEAYAAYGSKGPLAGLNVDTAALIAAIGKTQGDTAYEQLQCVGLDPNGAANLVGTFTIKRPYGYLGSQCQSGSKEYVAFWIDWLDGQGWQWAGASQVKVHDFATLPSDGLKYAVAQPIDLSKHLKLCGKGPVYAKIRGILSWNVAPPSWNPNYVPVWGNHLDGMIEVAPGIDVPIGDYTPYLEGVCGVAGCSIDAATGFAPGESPFGGSLAIYGYIPGAPKLGPTTTYPAITGLPRYAVKVRPQGSPAWQTVNDSFGVALEQQIGGGLPTSVGVTQTVDADGRYPSLNVTPDAAAGWQESFPSHLLTVWNTAGKTGLWEISVEAYDPVTNTLFPAGSLACSGGGSTSNLTIDLDNAAPLTALAITGVSHAGVLPPGATPDPALDCSSFTVGDVIYGTYSASDEHFGSLSLTIEPSLSANGAVVELSVDNFVTVNATTRSYPPVSNTGESGQWRLDTSQMAHCGYTVQLQANDRTIANCVGPWYNAPDFIGFCLTDPSAQG